MPHITVEMLPGRTEEQKLMLISKLTDVTARSLGIPEERVRVEIRETRPSPGKSQRQHEPKPLSSK